MRQSQDSIRKQDAFDGRVILPFLETIPSSGSILTTVPGSSAWAVFEMRNDAPRLHLKQEGLVYSQKGGMVSP